MKFPYLGLYHKTQQVHFPTLNRKVAKKKPISENHVSGGHPLLVLPNSTYYLYLKVSVQFFKPHPTHQVYLLTICENQPWGNAGCISKEINLKETITFDGKISFFDKFL